VVLAITLPPDMVAPALPDPQPSVPSPAAAAASRLGPFETALRAGDSEQAVRLYQGLGDSDRRAAGEALGRAVRSAAAAEAVLDALPAAEQVALAAKWAESGLVRPVAFARLRELLGDQAAAPAVRQAAAELARNPDLHAWLHSYGLTAG
jgi:hypothetical protein